MARSRNIKPGFFSNDKLAEINPIGRLLFAGLWTIADRKGRLEDRPKKIKAEVLPYDNCNVDKLLNELQERGFIVRYEIENSKYIQVLNFEKHQNPHTKEAASTLPAYDEPDAKQVLESKKDVASRADSGFLIPDSPIPDSQSLIPDSSFPPLAIATAPAKKKTEVTEEKKLENKATWTAYAFAYHARYGVDPVQNAKVNAQISNLVKRLGSSESPAVAAFYCRHNKALYVNSKHCMDLLLRDCEGIRTEWATGKVVTETEARQIDRKQNNLSVADTLIAEVRAKNAL